MGIPGDEPNFVYGDNRSALANVSNPGFTLKKTSAAVAYHFVRDGCACDEWRTSYTTLISMSQTCLPDLFLQGRSDGDALVCCYTMLYPNSFVGSATGPRVQKSYAITYTGLLRCRGATLRHWMLRLHDLRCARWVANPWSLDPCDASRLCDYTHTPFFFFLWVA